VDNNFGRIYRLRRNCIKATHLYAVYWAYSPDHEYGSTLSIGT